MISQLLATAGTVTLAGAVAASGYWASRVYADQPALPDLSAATLEDTDQAAANRRAETRAARPEVFYAALLERPLFAPGRRPVTPEPEIEVVVQEPAPAPAPVPEKPPAPDLKLLGVMGTGDTNRALVANGPGDPIWIDAGTTIAGWAVATIGTDWLELSLESETIRIEMYQQ